MVQDSDLLEQSQERYFSAHNLFLQLASDALTDIDEGMPGLFDHAFVATTMAALAIEAMANAIGDRIVRDWKQEHDRKSPFEKLRLLASRVGFTYAAAEPWQTIRWLCKFRNAIAHAKPELVRATRTITRAEHDLIRRNMPMSCLERSVNEEKARRAYQSVVTMRDELCARIDPELAFGLFSDAWMTSTKLHRPPEASGMHL